MDGANDAPDVPAVDSAGDAGKIGRGLPLPRLLHLAVQGGSGIGHAERGGQVVLIGAGNPEGDE